MTIPDSLRNLYDPYAPDFYPEISANRYEASTGQSIGRTINRSAWDFWKKKADEIESSVKEQTIIADPVYSDADALWKWKFHRQAFIDYGKQTDLDCMLGFVREGENGYDDIALADWESESRHQPSWWLAAWWHRRCARARDFWEDHFGSARLRQPGKERGRPLGLLGDGHSAEVHQGFFGRATGRRRGIRSHRGGTECRCLSCGRGLG